jgi:hypothetical protein
MAVPRAQGGLDGSGRCCGTRVMPSDVQVTGGQGLDPAWALQWRRRIRCRLRLPCFPSPVFLLSSSPPSLPISTPLLTPLEPNASCNDDLGLDLSLPVVQANINCASLSSSPLSVFFPPFRLLCVGPFLDFTVQYLQYIHNLLPPSCLDAYTLSPPYTLPRSPSACTRLALWPCP